MIMKVRYNNSLYEISVASQDMVSRIGDILQGIVPGSWDTPSSMADLLDYTVISLASTQSGGDPTIFYRSAGTYDYTYKAIFTDDVLGYDSTQYKWYLNSTEITDAAAFILRVSGYIPSVGGGTTYSISMSSNVITLTGSNGSTSTVTLPVYNGGVST